MIKKGSALLALLSPGKGKMADEDDEEVEPRPRKNPLLGEEDDTEDEEMDDDAEGEEAAQALLDALDAKDPKAVLEAFAHLSSVC